MEMREEASRHFAFEMTQMDSDERNYRACLMNLLKCHLFAGLK
jgi:hypothetical protein